MKNKVIDIFYEKLKFHFNYKFFVVCFIIVDYKKLCLLFNRLKPNERNGCFHDFFVVFIFLQKILD